MDKHSWIAGNRKLWAAFLSLLALGAVVALSASKPAGAANKSAALTSVTYLAPAKFSGMAGLEIGKQRGYFKEEGIDLKIQYDVPFPQVIPSLLTGRAQFAGFGWPAAILAATNGVPIFAVGQMNIGGPTKETDDVRLIALQSSGIKTIRDLKGKTVAIPVLGAPAELGLRYQGQRAGLGLKDIKFAQINTPDANAALRANRVDAIMEGEPYVAQLASQVKINVIAGLSTLLVKGGELGSSVNLTSRSYLAANKPIVDAFRRASNRSIAYARTHPKQVLAFLPGFLGLPKSLIARSVAPRFDEKINFAKLQRLVTITYNYGKVNKKLDVRSLVK